MAEMRITVEHTGKGFALRAKTDGGATMTFDGGEGGADGATPMQHVLAATGACALMDVGHILTKKRLAWSNLRVECVGAREKRGDVNPFVGMKLVFRVEGDVPAKAFDDAVRLSVEKYCSVGETLKAPVPIAFEAKVG